MGIVGECCSDLCQGVVVALVGGKEGLEKAGRCLDRSGGGGLRMGWVAVVSCRRWWLGFGVGLRFEKVEDVCIFGLMELYSGEVKNPKTNLLCT